MTDELVLVTGGSGYVAANVIKLLQENGYKVRATVRDSKNEKKVKPLKELCHGAKHEIEIVDADLMKPETWLSAVKDCEYVIHIASPFPLGAPRNEDEVIKPAVDGTLNVLKACADAKTVKRVVLTSSLVSIAGRELPQDNGEFSEKDWLNTEDRGVSVYPRSKALAERAAWKFVDELPEKDKFEFAVVNPSLVLGPVNSGGAGASVDLINKFMKREYPMLPQFCFPVCDVRDVAMAHYKCMTLPEAVGHRHIIMTDQLMMKSMAEILEKEFKPQGYNIPTRNMPNFLVSFLSLFNGEVREGRDFGKLKNINTSRMKQVLGITPIPAERSIIEMAYSMIERGFTPKTSQYKGPSS